MTTNTSPVMRLHCRAICDIATSETSNMCLFMIIQTELQALSNADHDVHILRSDLHGNLMFSCECFALLSVCLHFQFMSVFMGKAALSFTHGHMASLSSLKYDFLLQAQL